jgi:dipeptidyl aminopeptidase/acylaminoacyl peptidase
MSIILSVFAVGCSAGGNSKDTKRVSTYLESRKSYSTVLKTRGPAPQDWHSEKTPAGVTEVSYQSGDLTLKAWLARPKNPATGKLAAVVYFHGGFAFGMSELEDCRPFLDAGFAVMTPALRGENGNPGNFELMFGEVDDAEAAVRWLASQPDVDQKRIYTFGHSVGGGISALLSLRADVPIRRGGSSGGLYSRDVFSGWREFVPFDVSIEKEKTLRLLVGNIGFMQREHIAYIGRKDSLARVVPEAESEARQSSAPLTIKLVGGDHFTSLAPAISAFVESLKFD